MVNIVNYQHSSEKKLRNLLILWRCGHKFTGNTDNARLSQCLSRGKFSSWTDTAHRQEGSTSITVLLQKLNQCFRRLFIVCNNVLDASAQCSLNRDLIIFVYLDQIRNNALDSRNPFFLFHDSSDTVSIAIITLCDILK